MYVSQSNFISINKSNKVAGNGRINNTSIWKYDIFQLQRFVRYIKEFVKCKEEPESKIHAVRSLWEEDVISLVT